MKQLLRAAPFALITGLILVVTTSAAQAKEMVSAAKDGVLLRTAPGPRATARWTVDQGYPLEVLGRKGAWLRVRDFENDRAWVLRARTARQPFVISTVRMLNVRRAPSLRAGVVTRAGYGDVMHLVERREKWINVRTVDGLTGWVSRRLVWGW